MRHVIHLEEFKPALPGARSWMAVQRAWDQHPERRPQLAASLRRFCRVVNRVVSRTALRR
ncbi:MAG: hypothetical protein P4L99_30410 [Chthoniobacter sp.]|nr:hypothetical protein [Chthoniobacter sp.]